MTDGDAKNSMSWKTPEVMVPFLGLVYFSFILIYLIVSFGASGFTLIFVPFLAVFLVSAFGVWRQKRVGFALSTAISAVFLLLEGTQIADAFAAVTIPEEFLTGVTGVPVLLAVLVYSALGLKLVWKKADTPRPQRMIPATSFVVLLIIGFIIGGITIGLVAAQTENRLLSGSSGGDISIVQGAGNPNGAQFYSPSVLHVVIGVNNTVVWVNHDGTTHTVTSKTGSTELDSPIFPTGDSFSHTFIQAGTYEYYCTIHPWMTGTVVVISG